MRLFLSRKNRISMQFKTIVRLFKGKNKKINDSRSVQIKKELRKEKLTGKNKSYNLHLSSLHKVLCNKLLQDKKSRRKISSFQKKSKKNQCLIQKFLEIFLCSQTEYQNRDNKNRLLQLLQQFQIEIFKVQEMKLAKSTQKIIKMVYSYLLSLRISN